MAKTSTLAVRFTATEKAALERAAADDERLVSPMVRKIVLAWLRANGYADQDSSPHAHRTNVR